MIALAPILEPGKFEAVCNWLMVVAKETAYQTYDNENLPVKENTANDSNVNLPEFISSSDSVKREVVSLNNGNRPRHRLNEAEQDYVKRIAGAFGVNVIFENVVKITGVDGDSYYDSHGNIHMDFSVVDPINILIKHELTHFGEDGKLYDSFVRAVKKSSAYKMWLDSQIPGEKSTAEKAAEYRESVMQRYRAAGENISPAGADAELIAHFAADNLFAGNGSGLDALIRQANAKDRPVLIQWIIDLINSVKSLFKGQHIPMEVLRLERKYTAMLKAAENALAETRQKNSAEGGNKFSIAQDNYGEDIVVIDTDQGLFAGVDESEYRKIAKDYLNEHFKNTVLPLSDYGLVSVNKTGIGNILTAVRRLKTVQIMRK